MEKRCELWADYRGRSHFALFDGLRCLSILAVIWHHTGGMEYSSIPLLRIGFLGVDLFFLISGFLIVTLILREKEKYRSFSIRNFYMRRALRIFPSYYLLLFLLSLYFTTAGANGDSSKNFFSELCYYATYSSNWIEYTTFMGITWSLSTEEQFYLIWPPIERYLSPFVPLLLAIFLLVNILLQYQFFDLESHFNRKYSDLEILQVTFTPILLGVALAHLLHRKKVFYFFAKAMDSSWSAPLFLFALCMTAVVNSDLTGTPRLLIHLFAMCLIASCVIREKNWLTPFLTNRVVMRIGAISYGMYLYHMVARHVIKLFALKFPFLYFSPLYFLSVTLFTYLLSEASYRFFEIKFLRLKEIFFRGEGASKKLQGVKGAGVCYSGYSLMTPSTAWPPKLSK